MLNNCYIIRTVSRNYLQLPNACKLAELSMFANALVKIRQHLNTDICKDNGSVCIFGIRRSNSHLSSLFYFFSSLANFNYLGTMIIKYIFI